MAIVKVSKFNLAFFADEHELLLDRLQGFTDVHFNKFELDEGLSPEGESPGKAANSSETHAPSLLTHLDRSEEETALQEEITKVKRAIATLSAYRQAPSGFLEKFHTELKTMSYSELKQASAAFPRDEILAEEGRLSGEIRVREERVRAIKSEITDMSHWLSLDFPLDDMQRVKKATLMHGLIPKRWRDELQQRVGLLEATHLELVSTDGQNQYVFIVSDERDSEKLPGILRDTGFSAVELSGSYSPQQAINSLEEKRNSLLKEITALKEEMSALSAGQLSALEMEYEMLNNQLLKAETQRNFARSKRVIFVEGFVPTEREAEFNDCIAHTLDTAYEHRVTAAAKDDPQVPIMLKNNAIVSPFETIVETYSLPLYTEVDPTPIMTLWYCLFFGMMLGDFGYGLILLLATTLLLKFVRLKKSTQQAVRFFQILSVPTILAGLAFGSFFGGIISFPSLIDPSTDYMAFLFLSVGLGFVNIFFGLGIKAYVLIKNGDVLAAVYDVLSWYLALGGALLYLLSSLLEWPSLVGKISMIAMILGMLLVLIFSARDTKGFGRFGWGLYNLYGISSYVGDLVSYTRIAALALSGGFIGYAVNLICGMLFSSGVAGIIGAAIVFIIFHLFNLFLSALSGYVHSMRLVYVEFFGKFFEGGGRPFRKFRSQAKYVEVQRDV